jgi:hypothetical protein
MRLSDEMQLSQPVHVSVIRISHTMSQRQPNKMIVEGREQRSTVAMHA